MRFSESNNSSQTVISNNKESQYLQVNFKNLINITTFQVNNSKLITDNQFDLSKIYYKASPPPSTKSNINVGNTFNVLNNYNADQFVYNLAQEQKTIPGNFSAEALVRLIQLTQQQQSLQFLQQQI